MSAYATALKESSKEAILAEALRLHDRVAALEDLLESSGEAARYMSERITELKAENERLRQIVPVVDLDKAGEPTPMLLELAEKYRRARPDDGRVEPHCGWAPGHYDNTCCVCGEVFHDSDKRAVTCLECADAELEKARVERVRDVILGFGLARQVVCEDVRFTQPMTRDAASDLARAVLAAADGAERGGR